MLRKAWCAPGRQEHATHEPFISRAMLAEVPLAGLSLAALAALTMTTSMTIVILLVNVEPWCQDAHNSSIRIQGEMPGVDG